MLCRWEELQCVEDGMSHGCHGRLATHQMYAAQNKHVIKFDLPIHSALSDNTITAKMGMYADENGDDQREGEIELATMGESSRIASARSSMAALRVADPQQGVTVQELPPVDRGIRAWTFCAAAFVLEMMVWGFGFRSVLICCTVA